MNLQIKGNLPLNTNSMLTLLQKSGSYRWANSNALKFLKMLFTGAKLLILDEPTSVLSPQEIEELFASLRQMADDGKAVLFITHKLEEVMRFSDRITVMRDGKQMEPILTIHANKADLVRSMLRRECRRTVKKTARSSYEQSVLRMENVPVTNDRGQVALNDGPLR